LAAKQGQEAVPREEESLLAQPTGTMLALQVVAAVSIAFLVGARFGARHG